MSNETVTNKVLFSDAIASNRWSKETLNDLGPVNFLDQLLSIGQFESRQLEEHNSVTSAPSDAPETNSANDNNEAADRTKEESEEAATLDAVPYVSALPQIPVVDVKNDNSTKRSIDSAKQKRLQDGSTSSANRDSLQIDAGNQANPETLRDDATLARLEQPVPFPSDLNDGSVKSAKDAQNQVQVSKSNETEQAVISIQDDDSWANENSGASPLPSVDFEKEAQPTVKVSEQPVAGSSGEQIDRDSTRDGSQKHNAQDASSEHLAKDQDSVEAKPVRNRRAERLTRDKRGDRDDDSQSIRESGDISAREAKRDSSNQPQLLATKELTSRSSSELADRGTTTASVQSVGAVSPSIVASSSIVPSAASTVPVSSTMRPGSKAETASITAIQASTFSSVDTTGGNQTNSVSVTPVPTVQSSQGNAATPSGMASGRSTGSISPYQEAKLVQRVLRGLEQLGDGGGQVKLRLHPPELGTLQLTLRMESGQMFAKMEVENSLARDALLGNVQTLKDRLATQGMQIETFDVQVASDSSNSSAGSQFQQGGFGSDSRWEQANSRYAEMNRNRLLGEMTSESKSPANAAWTRKNGSLDVTV